MTKPTPLTHLCYQVHSKSVRPDTVAKKYTAQQTVQSSIVNQSSYTQVNLHQKQSPKKCWEQQICIYNYLVIIHILQTGEISSLNYVTAIYLIGIQSSNQLIGNQSASMMPLPNSSQIR